MSLVGPRPMAIRDFEGFSEDWQRRRFSVPPGITCLWQINGRNSVPFQQWMEMDMQYIAEWSLWLDLKILARTIPAVWKGIGRRVTASETRHRSNGYEQTITDESCGGGRCSQHLHPSRTAQSAAWATFC